MTKEKNIFIPYIAQGNIQKYYFTQNKTGNFAKTFATGLYPVEDNDEDFKYATLAENLLIYDTCYITFDDFLYLLKKINLHEMLELLRSGALKIVNTNAIAFSCVFGFDKNSFLTLFKENLTLDFEKAINENLKSSNNSAMKDLVYWFSKQSIDIVQNEKILDSILSESYRDLENKNIRSYFEIDKMDLKNLSGYNNFMLNRIFFLNYTLKIANVLNINNIHHESILADTLGVKLGAYINTNLNESHSNFIEILNLNEIVDISKHIISNTLNFNDIIKIRESRDCIKFREWLHSYNSVGIIRESDKKEISTLYNNACKPQESIWDNKYFKMLRFGTTLTAGVANTTAGVGVSISEAIIDKIIHKHWNPSIFIVDELNEYINKKLNKQKFSDEKKKIERIYGHIGRNDPCPCNSGKKYKKCHGK